MLVPIAAVCARGWLLLPVGGAPIAERLAGTDLTDAFAGIPEVEECHHIAGEADYLLKIRARDTHHLEAVIVRLQAITSVFTSETDIVLSTAFERRPLRLVDADETDGPGPA